jgi:hypothetical protein
MALPPVPQRVPMTGPDGLPTAAWAVFFRELAALMGGGSGAIAASDVSYDNDTSLMAADDVQAAIDEARIPTGFGGRWYTATPPTGWVIENGTTIGGAASGATGRANADTANLFAYLWTNFDNTALAIQNSDGTAGARGASAAADFAANKRMPTFDNSGLVMRGTGTGTISGRSKVGPTAGSTQEDQFQGHYHTMSIKVAADATGGGSFVSGATSSAFENWPSFFSGTSHGLGDSGSGTPRSGSETRVASRGVYWIIKL